MKDINHETLHALSLYNSQDGMKKQPDHDLKKHVDYYTLSFIMEDRKSI